MTPGTYTQPESDLQLIVYRVYAKGSKHWKIKGMLVNKKNGIVYQKISKVLLNHHMVRIGGF